MKENLSENTAFLCRGGSKKYFFKVFTNIPSVKCWTVFSDIHHYFIFTSTDEYKFIQMYSVPEVRVECKNLSSLLAGSCECWCRNHSHGYYGHSW